VVCTFRSLSKERREGGEMCVLPFFLPPLRNRRRGERGRQRCPGCNSLPRRGKGGKKGRCPLIPLQKEGEKGGKGGKRGGGAIFFLLLSPSPIVRGKKGGSAGLLMS